MTRADFRTSNSSGELNKLSFSDKEAIKPLLIGLVKKNSPYSYWRLSTFSLCFWIYDYQKKRYGS